MDVINLIRLSFVAATLIIAILLIVAILTLKKGNRKANIALIIIITIYSLSSLSSFLMFSGIYKNIPTLVLIGYPFVFIVGPIYYFYVQFLLNKDLKFKIYDLLNFIPLLYVFFKLKWFLPLSYDRKISALTNAWFGGHKIGLTEFIRYSIPNSITVIYLIISFILISKTAKKLKKDSSNTDIEYLSWLKKFTILYIILVIIDVVRLGLTVIFEWNAGEGEIITNLLISILILYYIFQSIKNPELVFYTLPTPKNIKKNENIKEVESKEIVKNNADFLNKLTSFMEEEKPYLNPGLKSHELAVMLNVTPHYLSKVINHEFNVNFYSFINKYRVEEFKRKVLISENKNLTLSAVAKTVGFNSKSSFNRIFKAITNTTPREYLKQNTNL